VPSATVLATLYTGAAAVGAYAAAIAWRHKLVPGAQMLTGMLLAAAFWAACDTIELHATTVAAHRLVSQVQYLGVVSAAPFFFCAALELAGRGSWLTPGTLTAVWSIPIATLGVAWTSASHQWLWRSITVNPITYHATYEYGWWFWLLTADHYLLMAIGSGVLVLATRRVSAPFRAPMLAVIAAVLLPWLGNVLYVFKLGPWPGLNWLSVSVIVSGALFAWIVGREGLLDPLPRARESLLETMKDAVIVVERSGRVLHTNPAVAGVFGASVAIGEPLPPAIWGAVSWDGGPGSSRVWHGEVPYMRGTDAVWLDVAIDHVLDRWGETAGRLIVVRDITTRKTIEHERERLIVDLEHALGHIKRLEGMLPICANCKRVREDGGNWRTIEEYVTDRAPVEFSHGICPTCMKELYEGE
jgi:PAS domain-containing protein